MNKNFHFVTGRQVTDQDKKAAPPNSVFRSTAAYQEGEILRKCASVSGAAPQAYRDAFNYIEPKAKPKPKPAANPAQAALING